MPGYAAGQHHNHYTAPALAPTNFRLFSTVTRLGDSSATITEIYADMDSSFLMS